jgi:hypothetical protein
LLDRAGNAAASATGTGTGTGNVVEDTLGGLAAFVVPGPDPYSVAQGATTREPGAVDAGVVPALIAGLNLAQDGQPALAASVADLLNSVAAAVRPEVADSPFTSAFANLRADEKAAVFAALEADPELAAYRPLVGVLPALVAFLAYSEVGVFDPATRSLTATPVGWTLSGYDGVADGRAELIGYFEDRRRADA